MDRHTDREKLRDGERRLDGGEERGGRRKERKKVEGKTYWNKRYQMSPTVGRIVREFKGSEWSVTGKDVVCADIQEPRATKPGVKGLRCEGSPFRLARSD